MGAKCPRRHSKEARERTEEQEGIGHRLDSNALRYDRGGKNLSRLLRLTVALAPIAVAAGAGVLAQTPGADIHYVPTPDAVVSAMLDLAGVTAADLVYDLGSGDGRIVIEAARKYGARGVGIEIDPELNKKGCSFRPTSTRGCSRSFAVSPRPAHASFLTGFRCRPTGNPIATSGSKARTYSSGRFVRSRFVKALGFRLRARPRAESPKPG